MTQSQGSTGNEQTVTATAEATDASLEMKLNALRDLLNKASREGTLTAEAKDASLEMKLNALRDLLDKTPPRS
ncbi:hypothetical protein MO767_17665 [Pseudomonas sp. UYIF39]|jgi:hypothetical protein|uniref:hypothetical protein n=1 Tax=Pseudomonas sp. UYIF39 TaxID=1630747 RepID=UPI00249DD453|nr:hypothetical protein [Pseudomonas sp. UYIF39]MDI3356163.1 hypothetical protein [Pseudomonas sp. UYIF39]